MSRWAEQLINHMLIVLVVLLKLYADTSLGHLSCTRVSTSMKVSSTWYVFCCCQDFAVGLCVVSKCACGSLLQLWLWAVRACFVGV